MHYNYLPPATDLKHDIGAYSLMTAPQGATEITRAEIPHIRFILTGEAMIRHGDHGVCFRAPAVLLHGPAMLAGSVAFAPGSVIFGASLTPVGWQNLTGMPAQEMATRQVPLDAIELKISPVALQDRFLSAVHHEVFANVANNLFRDLLSRKTRSTNTGFMEAASRWLLDERSLSVEVLRKTVGVSARQLDRLCNTYFGAPPKRLQRKYRALHVANRFAWTGERDWRAVIGDHYYDQSHFIREFKEMIGCTPGHYIEQPNMMIRLMMIQRLSIPHHNRLSLVG